MSDATDMFIATNKRIDELIMRQVELEKRIDGLIMSIFELENKK